jgi:phosphoheptose isomerase
MPFPRHPARYLFSLPIVSILSSAPLHGEAAVFVGTEFQVNVYTTSTQRAPEVGMDEKGNFVVAWSSAQDGSDGIFARRFDPDGAPLAAEFQVNTYTTGPQLFPALAVSAGGDFVVTWRSTQDGSEYGVFARRFDVDGAPQAAEFQVNTFTANRQSAQSVAISSSGAFVVVWASIAQDGSGYGVFARRFDAAGTALAVEFQVNTVTADPQTSPAVGSDAAGNFVVAWTSDDQDGPDYGVFAQRFNAAGVPQATEFQVNTYTPGSQSLPAVALSTSGDFVITWTSFGQDGSSNGVFARRFDAAGTAQASEFRVNTQVANAQDSPSVTLEPDGGFLIAWRSVNQDGNADGVFARRFDAAGTAQASEFRVNTYVTGYQNEATVGSDANGRFVVAWTSSIQDGFGFGIFAQRLRSPAGLDLDGNGTTDALTDGLLLLRRLFGFSGAALTAGAVGPGCTRCDAAAIVAYVPTPPVEATLRLGSEFQVNTHTSNAQVAPAVALSPVGDFVVAWHSNAQDGAGSGTFGRGFDAAGVPVASEFQVNSHTSSGQFTPSVGRFPSGDFVVSWMSSDQDGSDAGVFAQRFDSPGVPLAAEFEVNTHTLDYQGRPEVAAAAGGDFVVVWQSNAQDGSFYGVFARRFDSAGVAQALEFQVNSFIADNQSEPDVALDGDGNLVVAWRSAGQDGSSNGIFARRFDSAGASLAAEFQVNTYTTGNQNAVAVAASASGAFVVAWQSLGQDGSSTGVFAQRFDAAGTPQAAEFQVNAFAGSAQFSPAVAFHDDGDFVIAWTSSGQDGSDYGVFARRFAAAGRALAAEFQVNTHTANTQRFPSLAIDDGRRLVISWSSEGFETAGQDGSFGGIFAQRFAILHAFDIDGNGTLGALTDGLLALRFLFGFTGPTLTAGAVGLGCTRCDAAAIEDYFQMLL